MINIQWFPGHMSKTLKDIQKNLKFVDCILIILDARIPFSSMNFELLKYLNNKPFLILFNKSSLADLEQNSFFLNFFHKKKIFHTLNIDAKNKINTHKIYPKIKEILNYKKQKVKKFLKFMIIGVPNVGKSTLINCLAGKKITKTSNLPGITKKMQWINLDNNMKLLDTPGVLWPKFKYKEIGYSLTICGCIKENIFIKEEIIDYLLKYLKTKYPDNLKTIFNLNNFELEKNDLLQILINKMYPNIASNDYDLNQKNNLLSIIFKKIKSNKMPKINYDLNFKDFL
ncbi:ribosome biogenesis GTPase YlqF [Columbia Basin potato purple top phytoplasma]|uniref:Ribosome biogenesis GTPase A n=1 Tax=Columbia Basin potato purple top phytoplasma TaxID=307134 RepID=A0ABT5L8A6_9MOLU|nr:ribosome biogenesis GTPase YlqF [Columbia Basin potato purple top phytoplasma]MDC9031808.1 ribosome biogenesis GTPase YlqF [Columbia Basin potato purple top phytoplasma]